jgi:hypothetical protein
MRKNSEIKAIPIFDADTAGKIRPKSTRTFSGFALFAVFLKNLKKINRKTVTPQIYSGLHITETITGLYRPGYASPAVLSFIYQSFIFERAEI